MQQQTTFFSMPSFEPRSTAAVKRFIAEGGNPKAIRTARISKNDDSLRIALKELEDLEVHDVSFLNREKSKDLWDWVWASAKDIQGDVIIDATCFTRELLGMLLFALSVRRDYLNSVEVQYVPAAPQGYATQNTDLSDEKRWLSKGVIAIRSIIGYPGNFQSDQRRFVIAFAGHEEDRLLEAIEFLEPNELAISNEQSNSSTVEGAAEISLRVYQALRERIPRPDISSVSGVDFSANSIEETYQNLTKLVEANPNKNTAVIPMNTKLSFIGAALAALQNRDIRLVYAVPEEYNPHYSKGEGKFKSCDITSLIKAAKTISVKISSTAK